MALQQLLLLLLVNSLDMTANTVIHTLQAITSNIVAKLLSRVCPIYCIPQLEATFGTIFQRTGFESR